jgi:nucleotide-binding universal stress UspA family protein
MAMKTCLVVANQTLPGDDLAAEIRQRIRASERMFYVVVPVAPVQRGATWDEADATRQAEERLQAFLESVRGHGATADGEIGDRDPIQAVRDVMRTRDVDEIVLSTLPPGISRWLQMDVPSRLERSVDVPVTVVTQERSAVSSGT